MLIAVAVACCWAAQRSSRAPVCEAHMMDSVGVCMHRGEQQGQSKQRQLSALPIGRRGIWLQNVYVSNATITNHLREKVKVHLHSNSFNPSA